MRHLSVPSKETAIWRQKLAEQNWLAQGHAIHNLGENRGLPLNETAPDEISGLEILDLEPLIGGPKHWTERLDISLYEEFKEYWPMSHDQIGDVVLIKIPIELESHKKSIAEAIISQQPNVRVVCADNGVKGDFRVRDLEVLDFTSNDSTETLVRENGNEFLTDPGNVYYSPRLANERQKTVELAQRLSLKLGRKISVCDPYAGVGPGVIPLAKSDFVEHIFASDLNPKAHQLLSRNLPNATTKCADARSLAEVIPNCCDLLLVNIPHSTIDHLPELIGLLKTGHEVIVKGWVIIEQAMAEDLEERVKQIFANHQINSIIIDTQKSYSPSEIYASFEIELVV